MRPDKIAEKIIDEKDMQKVAYVVYEVVDYLHLKGMLANRLEAEVVVKLADITEVISEFEDKLNLCLGIDEGGDKCHECDETRDLLTELKTKIDSKFSA